MNWRKLNLKYNFLSFQTITQVLNWRKLNLNIAFLVPEQQLNV